MIIYDENNPNIYYYHYPKNWVCKLIIKVAEYFGYDLAHNEHLTDAMKCERGFIRGFTIKLS